MHFSSCEPNVYIAKLIISYNGHIKHTEKTMNRKSHQVYQFHLLLVKLFCIIKKCNRN